MIRPIVGSGVSVQSMHIPSGVQSSHSIVHMTFEQIRLMQSEQKLSNDFFVLADYVFGENRSPFTLCQSEGKIKCSPFDPQKLAPASSPIQVEFKKAKVKELSDDVVAHLKKNPNSFVICKNFSNPAYHYDLVFYDDATDKFLFRPVNPTTKGPKNGAESIHLNLRNFFEETKRYAYEYCQTVATTA